MTWTIVFEGTKPEADVVFSFVKSTTHHCGAFCASDCNWNAAMFDYDVLGRVRSLMDAARDPGRP